MLTRAVAVPAPRPEPSPDDLTDDMTDCQDGLGASPEAAAERRRTLSVTPSGGSAPVGPQSLCRRVVARGPRAGSDAGRGIAHVFSCDARDCVPELPP